MYKAQGNIIRNIHAVYAPKGHGVSRQGEHHLHL